MLKIAGVLRHYLGLDLPARTLDLNFGLPKASAKFKAGKSSDGDFKHALEEEANIPSAYFGLILAEIKHVNRCALTPKQRHSLMYDIFRLYYPKALSEIARHAQTGGVPELEERKQSLNLLVEIAQILIVSGQILFAGYYGGSNFKYARSRKAVMECASCIFELLLLKQQARALRYKLLDEQDWQIANTLFYVMSCYEDVTQALPTLQKILELGGGRTKVSLQEQFVRLNVVAKFDMLRWPTHLQWVIDSYLLSVENAVQVRLADSSAQPLRNELIAYCYSAYPAGGVVAAQPSGAAILLNCNGLTDAIRKDCMGLIQANKNDVTTSVPPRFVRFPEEERFVISEQLVRGLQNSAEDVVQEKEVRVEDLRIFVGLAEVFSLLRHKQSQYASEDRLADVLAKRSALIAEDEVATEKSVWSLLFQNEKMIRLSTQETSFTTRMNIGSLLAYGVGEDINRPSLAVVSRIFRPSHKVVVIDMYCIANYAEAVMMTINAQEQSSTGQLRGKPALLVYNKKTLGGWGLMFPPQDVLPAIDQIALHRNQQIIEIKLETRRNATNDFYLFSSTLQSGQLGVTGEPDYAVPSVRKSHPSGWLI